MELLTFFNGMPRYEPVARLVANHFPELKGVSEGDVGNGELRLTVPQAYVAPVAEYLQSLADAELQTGWLETEGKMMVKFPHPEALETVKAAGAVSIIARFLALQAAVSASGYNPDDALTGGGAADKGLSAPGLEDMVNLAATMPPGETEIAGGLHAVAMQFGQQMQSMLAALSDAPAEHKWEADNALKAFERMETIIEPGIRLIVNDKSVQQNYHEVVMGLGEMFRSFGIQTFNFMNKLDIPAEELRKTVDLQEVFITHIAGIFSRSVEEVREMVAAKQGQSQAELAESMREFQMQQSIARMKQAINPPGDVLSDRLVVDPDTGLPMTYKKIMGSTIDPKNFPGGLLGS